MTENRSRESLGYVDSLCGGDDAATVLLLADASAARRSCLEHLQTTSDWSDVLVVTFDGRLDAWVHGVEQGAHEDRRVTIVSVGEQARSSAAADQCVSAPESDDQLRVETIPDPTATAALVDVIADGWYDRRAAEGTPVLWLHSIETALEVLGPERGIKVVEAIVGRCRARDARGYFHLDPSDLDGETLRSVYALFDEVVQLDENADPPTWRPDGFLWSPTVDEGSAVEGTAPGGSNLEEQNGEGADVAEPDEAGDPHAPYATDELHDTPASEYEGGYDTDSTVPDDDEADDARPRVLVVGETSDTTELLAAFLEWEGNLVVETETEPAAMLRPERLADVGCIVSDLDLDGTTAETFLRRLRAIDFDLPVLWLAPDHSAIPGSLDADPNRPSSGSEGLNPDRVFGRDRDGFRELAEYIPLAIERAEARHFREAFRQSPHPIVLLEPNGTVERYGGTFDILLPELDESDFPDRFSELFPDEDEIGQGIAIAADGEHWTGELELQTEDADEAIPVRVSLNPVVTGGTVGRIVASIVDVSAYHEREAGLEAERNRIEQAVKLLAHDLRNLLFVIDGNLETARESVETIESSFDRIEGRIRDAEALTSDAVLESVTAVDLGPTVEDAWGALETQDCRLVVDDSATILADRNLLERLLENLFTNAVTHAGDDVTVRVGTMDEGFFIEDDGVGIPPEDRDRVFDEHFSTADSTGLGLSVVASVVDAHGWEIEIRESAEGGARFEITGVAFG